MQNAESPLPSEHGNRGEIQGRPLGRGEGNTDSDGEKGGPRPAALVLVTGATGQQGGAVAQRLLTDGWRVRALTRDAAGAAAKSLAALGAEIAEGDMGDRATLDTAAAGAHGVFSVQPTPGMPGLAPGYGPEDEIRHGRNVADAAHAAGAQHLVYASAFGADQDGSLTTLANKWAIEEHIRALGLSATVLRPTSFMENLLHPVWGLRDGALATPFLPGTRQQWIALADIAAFAALALTDPAHLRGQALDLAGDTLTPVETAAALSRAVVGREVPYVQVPIEVVRQQSEEAARGVESLNEGRHAPVDPAPLRALHPGLRTFADWLAEPATTARLTALPTPAG